MKARDTFRAVQDHLQAHPGCSAEDVAAATGVKMQQVMLILATLVAYGYATRDGDAFAFTKEAAEKRTRAKKLQKRFRKRLLKFIRKRGPVSVAQVAGKIGLPVHATKTVLKGYVKKGLIARQDGLYVVKASTDTQELRDVEMTEAIPAPPALAEWVASGRAVL